MANRKWTQQDRETIVRMWRGGATQAEIAEAVHASRGDVNAQVQYMRSVGVDLPHRKESIDVSRLNSLQPKEPA